MATAGVVNNFGAASPSPAGSVVKCYCHQCSKNFILVDQNTVSSCNYGSVQPDIYLRSLPPVNHFVLLYVVSV